MTLRKSNDDTIKKQEPVEEVIIPPEKWDKILNNLRKILWIWNAIKYQIIKRLNCIQIFNKKMVRSKWVNQVINVLLSKT